MVAGRIAPSTGSLSASVMPRRTRAARGKSPAFAAVGRIAGRPEARQLVPGGNANRAQNAPWQEAMMHHVLVIAGLDPAIHRPARRAGTSVRCFGMSEPAA
jgi:hypothetical protein